MTDDARRSHRRLRRVAWCVLLVTTAVVLLYAVFSSSESAAERAQRLGSEIRCPDCQGLSAQDSDTRTATAIRVEVVRRVAAGESDERIRQAFVDRYGEFILLRPSTSGIGALVWALPGVVFLIGGGSLLFVLRRWSRQPRLRPTAEESELVERVRAEARSTARAPGSDR